MTTTVLIIVNVFAALAIIVLALMQQSKGDMGSAFGGGGSQSMFGSRGSANFLSRTTAIMCVVFFVSSLALAYVYAQRAEDSSVVENTSVLDQLEATEESEVPVLDADNGATGSEIPVIDSAAESEVPSLEQQATETAESIEEAVQGAAEEAEQAVEEATTDK